MINLTHSTANVVGLRRPRAEEALRQEKLSTGAGQGTWAFSGQLLWA